MNTKEKCFLRILGIVVFLLLGISIKSYAQNGVDVLDVDGLKKALVETTGNINVMADMDLSGLGAIDVTGRTINLNQHTIKNDNMGVIFEGSNFTIKNGTFEVNKGTGAYALFIGDSLDSNHIVVEDLTLIGGINIFNATEVEIRNLTIEGIIYYAIWCDEHAQVTVKSGNFQSDGVAVLGMVESEKETKLVIEGGNYIAKEDQPMVLANRGIPEIAGGIFNMPVLEEYCRTGYEPVEIETGYTACNHKETILKNKKEATCEEKGYTGDQYCKICNKLMQEGEVTEALGHKPSEWKQDAVEHWKECTQDGCESVIAGTKETHKFVDGICTVCSYKQEKKNNTIVNPETKVQLEYDGNSLPNNTKLEVILIEEGGTYQEVKETLPEVKQFMLFDISLLSNGTKIQPNGKVKISIPVPETFDTSKLIVYRMERQEKIEYEVKIVTIDDKTYAQFETDHFSNYVLAEIEKQEEIIPDVPDKDTVLDDEPKTGTVNIVAEVGIVFGLAIIGYIIGKKKMYQ